jgi:hypothetical protein
MITEILSGLLIALFAVMIGILFGGRGKITIDDFEKHRESPNPHIACPVHTVKLNSIERKLDSMDCKIDRLIEKE